MAWNAGPACAGISGRLAWNPQSTSSKPQREDRIVLEIVGESLEFEPTDALRAAMRPVSEGLGVELFGALNLKRLRQRGLQLQRSMPLPKRPKT